MLLFAISRGDSPGIERYLTNASSLSPDLLSAALVVACQVGDLATGERLIHLGANPNALPNIHDLDDFTPLYAAALSGHAEVVHLLLQNGADPNLTRESHGMSPLAAAVDAEADFASQLGQSPTMRTSRLILDAGGDPRLRDKRGKSALDIANAYGYQEAVLAFESVSCRMDLNNDSVI